MPLELRMSHTDRRTFLQKSLAAGAVAASGASFSSFANAMRPGKRLEVAAVRFGTMADVGENGGSHLGHVISKVAGPLKTTVMLLKDGELRTCIVCFDGALPLKYTKKMISRELGMALENIVIFTSHNHSGAPTGGTTVPGENFYNVDRNDPKYDAPLTPFGQRVFAELTASVRRLPGMLEPVSVWHAEGTEGRITYNRKGRRADGSTYFMREEDRVLIDKDFNGDIDRQAPVVVFRNDRDKAVAALVQFTGHPVTSYKPEDPVVFGEWPQIATDIVARELANGGEPVPVGFLQGCCGDVNSKEMFTGGVERATEFGEMLGESYVKALQDLRLSERDGMSFTVESVPVPCGPLPSLGILKDEIAEMHDFIKRADAGREDTLDCVGLNFPRALSPKYRGALVKSILPWSEWALDLRKTGRADTVLKSVDLPTHVFRIGDVGIIGMQCEPFQGIGRRMRELSPTALTIPCGYANGSQGYFTDSANTGDREYMSSFYRYTSFRPPFKAPAGDVVADRAVQILRQS
ncbi:hypothetical protein BA177_03860 [Woeseia oceani]|uniref:Neutral/alkaline non-lysosomal ceramidase N-terminal domain-containing protein n=2 Tax=Woeseia oceani TaxID=1548547 RepID=A0A193LDA2_9GAMM|nr:hypothetical protein BA177_03860 [Woeseia oceani]